MKALFFSPLLLFFVFLCTDVASAQSAVNISKDTGFLENLLKKYPQFFSNILEHRDSFKVQIIYTQIDRDANNNPSFTDYYYGIDSVGYFYPASTVKLPVALLALQKMNELRLPGLDKNSTFVTESGFPGETVVLNDPSTPDGRPTVANYVRKIFLVSDNDAFNRLYEFLGQQYINERLAKMGYADVQILHRLSLKLSEDQNRHTNPVSFYDPSGRILYKQPMLASQYSFAKRSDWLGKGYHDADGTLVDKPMEFSKKNRISLPDLHNILRSVMFPGSVPVIQRFNLTRADYQFLYQCMSQYPSESRYPPYDSTYYWDAFGKLLYWGNERGKLPENPRIFNKEGDAYGFLTDVSYFVDFDKKIEFMLSASIYCNSDGILNDDQYDYQSLGLPFLKNLGRVLYEYEKVRLRAYTANLEPFRVQYER